MDAVVPYLCKAAGVPAEPGVCGAASFLHDERTSEVKSQPEWSSEQSEEEKEGAGRRRQGGGGCVSCKSKNQGGAPQP